jgi:predicted amidophosphoribosyltransferase
VVSSSGEYGVGTHPGRRSILARAADIVWPPRSLLSDRIVDRPGAIEAALWAELKFLARPLCTVCGFPFETAAEDGAFCGACTADPPTFATARAALVYDDHARRLVLDLKRGGRRDGLKVFAHWTRLLERRFNQSAWLAQAVSSASGKPLVVDLLTRRRRRKSQEGLSASQRRRNVEGVFAVAPLSAGRVQGRIVVLIDDVFTTGATAGACAKALLRAKAAKVHVLTLARVVRPVDVSI